MFRIFKEIFENSKFLNMYNMGANIDWITQPTRNNKFLYLPDEKIMKYNSGPLVEHEHQFIQFKEMMEDSRKTQFNPKVL